MENPKKVKFLLRKENPSTVTRGTFVSFGKTSSSFHLFRFRSPGVEDEFVPIEGAASKYPSYIPTKEDINCVLKCMWVGEIDRTEHTISAFTDPIAPGTPKVTSMKIEGGPYFTRLFKLDVEYFGGEEGNSKIQWAKSTPDGSYHIIEGNNLFTTFIHRRSKNILSADVRRCLVSTRSEIHSCSIGWRTGIAFFRCF